MSPAEADSAVTYAVLIVLAIIVAAALGLWAHANALRDAEDAERFGGTDAGDD